MNRIWISNDPIGDGLYVTVAWETAKGKTVYADTLAEAFLDDQEAFSRELERLAEKDVEYHLSQPDEMRAWAEWVHPGRDCECGADSLLDCKCKFRDSLGRRRALRHVRPENWPCEVLERAARDFEEAFWDQASDNFFITSEMSDEEVCKALDTEVDGYLVSSADTNIVIPEPAVVLETKEGESWIVAEEGLLLDGYGYLCEPVSGLCPVMALAVRCPMEPEDGNGWSRDEWTAWLGDMPVLCVDTDASLVISRGDHVIERLAFATWRDGFAGLSNPNLPFLLRYADMVREYTHGVASGVDLAEELAEFFGAVGFDDEAKRRIANVASDMLPQPAMFGRGRCQSGEDIVIRMQTAFDGDRLDTAAMFLRQWPDVIPDALVGDFRLFDRIDWPWQRASQLAGLAEFAEASSDALAAIDREVLDSEKRQIHSLIENLGMACALAMVYGAACHQADAIVSALPGLMAADRMMERPATIRAEWPRVDAAGAWILARFIMTYASNLTYWLNHLLAPIAEHLPAIRQLADVGTAAMLTEMVRERLPGKAA